MRTRHSRTRSPRRSASRSCRLDRSRAPLAAGDALSGGDGTVFDSTRNAFSLPARNLREEHRPSFFVGNSFFNQNWVVAPASVAARDGLGPLFNARSCSGCHFKDGRGRPPEPGEPMDTMLLRISVPGAGAHGAPQPDPVYGDQIQGQSIPGVPREADVFVSYEEVPGAFADGEAFSLREPSYRIANLGYGPMSSAAADVAARIARDHRPRAARGDAGGDAARSPIRTIADGDGISGRVNIVWDHATNRTDVGRFGWKAEQPTVLQQTAAAFVGDIGITSPLFPDENHTAARQRRGAAAVERRAGVSDKIFQAVALYARSLAVPAARSGDDPQALRGRQLFAAARCDACHVPELETGASPELPEFAHQTIHPYTDLLLHDMGEASPTTGRRSPPPARMANAAALGARSRSRRSTATRSCSTTAARANAAEADSLARRRGQRVARAISHDAERRTAPRSSRFSTRL